MKLRKHIGLLISPNSLMVTVVAVADAFRLANELAAADYDSSYYELASLISQ
jgi:transcriptional regulator GlxA family with amidase domain